MLTARGSAEALDPDRLFADLGDAPALCLAVSGGPDSTAMLGLAARWRAGRAGGPALHVATVDHGLRAGSAAEAAMVAALAARFDLPHAILRWEGAKPTTRIQEAARAVRYRLLGTHCRAIGAPILLVAHHGDDQAETVLMRLGRGSGVAGLAAMRRRTPLPDGTLLVRPLLGCAKADLVDICRREHWPYAIDPSNGDETFHRVRLRRRAAEAAALGLTPATLRRLARRMARADEALEAEVARFWDIVAPRALPEGWTADLAAVRAAEPEILQRVVGRLVAPAGDRRALSLARLERLAEALGSALAGGTSFRGTLGGACVALDGDGILRITPEPPRRRGRSRRD